MMAMSKVIRPGALWRNAESAAPSANRMRSASVPSRCSCRRILPEAARRRKRFARKESFAPPAAAHKIFPVLKNPPETRSSSAGPSDLTQLCLPPAFHDANRKLAWANSICLLFLLVGLAGWKTPRSPARPPARRADSVPVFLAPPEPAPKLRAPERKAPATPAPAASDDAAVASPAVTAVVAADAELVPFAVPVAGPAPVVPVRLAPTEAPPHGTAPALRPTPFVPSEADWGGHPRPDYPALALQRGYQGRVVLEIVVQPSGEVASVRVAESSGYQILDDTAREHVRRHLRLRQPPGETRLHTVAIVFQLRP
jgi:TonB family protein